MDPGTSTALCTRNRARRRSLAVRARADVLYTVPTHRKKGNAGRLLSISEMDFCFSYTSSKAHPSDRPKGGAIDVSSDCDRLRFAFQRRPARRLQGYGIAG
jgi:hypothetical protein